MSADSDRAKLPGGGVLLPLLASLASAAPHATAVPYARAGSVVAVDDVHVLAAGLRVELAGDDVRIAEDGFTSAIPAAAPTADGWLFLSRDGVLATSATWTGPLRRVADAPAAIVASQAGIGRITFRDEGGRWAWADAAGIHGFEGLPAPPMSAAFADTRRGAVVLPGGALRTTDDGGATWTDAPIGDDAAVALLAEGGAVRVYWAARAPTDLFTGPSHEPPRELTDLQQARIRAAQAAGAPAAPLGPWGPRDAGGRHLVPWGARTLGVRSTEESLTIAVRDPDGWTPLRIFPTDVSPAGGFLAGADGRSLAVVAPCRPEAPTDGRAVCLTTDGGATWREADLPAAFADLEALAGTRLLVRLGRPASDAPLRLGGEVPSSWSVVDVATGAVTPLSAPRASGDAGTHAARLLPDGTVVATVGPPGAGTPRFLAVGEPDALRLLPLPKGAELGTLLDARTGFARGADGSALWSTGTGGRRWKPLRLAVDGDPALLDLADSELGCDATGCATGAGGIVRLDEVARRPSLARAVPLAPLPPEPEGARRIGLRCSPGAPVTAPALPPPAAGVTRTRIPAADLTIALDVGSDGLATLRWTDGATEAASQPFGPTDPDGLVFGATTGDAVLLLNTGASSAYWWAVAGRAPVVVERPGRLPDGPAIPDGAGGLWVGTTGAGPWDLAAWAVHLRPDGIPPREVYRAVPRGGGGLAPGWIAGPVLAGVLDGATLQIVQLEGTGYETRPLGAVDAVCSGPEAPSAVYLPASRLSDATEWSGSGRARVELSPEGPCVREIRVVSWQAPRREIVARAAGGELVGTLDDGRAVTCTVEPVPALPGRR